MTSPENPKSMPETPAFHNLRAKQVQVDDDGVFVTVSRQAVAEVLEEYRALQFQLSEAKQTALASEGRA